MENMYDEGEIDLRELFFALKKRLFLILAIGLLCGCLSFAYTKFFITPIYTSTSSMLVLTKETTLSSIADLQIGSQLTKDYTVLTTSRDVLNTVIDNLGLDMNYRQLRANIAIDNPADTRILNISVTDTNPEDAKRIVDELASVAAAYIGDKMEVIPPKIIEKGEIPTIKTSPSMSKNTMLGLLAGILLSVSIVVVVTIMNDTLKTEDDIEKYLGMPTLAVVPDRKDYVGQKRKKGRRTKKRSKGDRA